MKLSRSVSSSQVAETLVRCFPEEGESVRVSLREKYNSLTQRLRHSTVLGTNPGTNPGTSCWLSVNCPSHNSLFTLINVDQTSPFVYEKLPKITFIFLQFSFFIIHSIVISELNTPRRFLIF